MTCPQLSETYRVDGYAFSCVFTHTNKVIIVDIVTKADAPMHKSTIIAIE